MLKMSQGGIAPPIFVAFTLTLQLHQDHGNNKLPERSLSKSVPPCHTLSASSTSWYSNLLRLLLRLRALPAPWHVLQGNTQTMHTVPWKAQLHGLWM